MDSGPPEGYSNSLTPLHIERSHASLSCAVAVNDDHHACRHPGCRRQVYITFQSNEGDTPKNAYSFRGGQWLSPSRGTVPIAWGVAPITGKLFPALWEYYVTTGRHAIHCACLDLLSLDGLCLAVPLSYQIHTIPTHLRHHSHAGRFVLWRD